MKISFVFINPAQNIVFNQKKKKANVNVWCCRLYYWKPREANTIHVLPLASI